MTTSWQHWRSGRWRPASAGWCHSASHEVPGRRATLCELLPSAGHDAVHTSELADGNRTIDEVLARLADVEGRVVITKDRDFRNGHLLHRSPRHLLVVTTGNIANRDLLGLCDDSLAAIVEALAGSPFVELGAVGLVVHAEPE